MRFFILTMVTMLLALQVQTQESDDKGATVIVSVKVYLDNKPAQEAQGALTPVASYARVHLVKKYPAEFIQIRLADDKGMVHFKGVPAGDYNLYVDGFSPPETGDVPIRSDEYAVVAVIESPAPINIEAADGGKITVKEDETTIHHTIILYPSTKLKVTVTYDDNTPIKGAKITLQDTRYGLRSFTKVEMRGDKPYPRLGNLTDEKGEYTVKGFNAELEPTVAIKVETGEEPLTGLQEDDFNRYRILRSKVISDIKLSSKQDNNISVKFRRLDQSKIVTRGKLRLTEQLSGQQISAYVMLFTPEEGESIRVYAGKIDVKDHEISCTPDDKDGFNYTLFDIKPGRYLIKAHLRQAFKDENKWTISAIFYKKYTSIVIEKNRITTLNIALTEADKHEIDYRHEIHPEHSEEEEKR